MTDREAAVRAFEAALDMMLANCPDGVYNLAAPDGDYIEVHSRVLRAALAAHPPAPAAPPLTEPVVPISREAIGAAIWRGWCAAPSTCQTIEPDLAAAIVNEVMSVVATRPAT